MGKFVDRVTKGVETVAGKVKSFKLKEDKLFQEIVKKADTLELALAELVEKVAKLEAVLNEVIKKVDGVKTKAEEKANKSNK